MFEIVVPINQVLLFVSSQILQMLSAGYLKLKKKLHVAVIYFFEAYSCC